MSSNPADAEQVIKGVGGLKHEDWRSFQNERVRESHPHLPKNRIDVKIEICCAPFRTTCDSHPFYHLAVHFNVETNILTCG